LFDLTDRPFQSRLTVKDGEWGYSAALRKGDPLSIVMVVGLLRRLIIRLQVANSLWIT